MKRALILAPLLLALALFAYLRPSAGHGMTPAPVADAGPARESASAAALELASNAETDHRTNLAPVSGTEDAPTTPSDAPPAQPVSVLVRVQVLYTPSNQPVHGATVKLGRTTVEARTGARGLAELRVRIGSRLELLRVDPGDDGDLFVPYERNLDQVLESGPCALEVRVERGVDLHGIVRDAATGRVVPHARVHCRGLGAGTDVATNEEGTFTLAALLSGAWNQPAALSVVHPDYLPAEAQPSAADLAPDARPLIIALDPGLRLAGRLLDSEHVPIAHAMLILVAPKGQQTNTDEDGRFAFVSLPPSDAATISVPSQALDQTILMRTDITLGPLRASRSDLELQASPGLVLHVFAELPGGRRLAPEKFELAGPGDRSLDMIGRSSTEHHIEISFASERGVGYLERMVPRGADVVIEAFASAPDSAGPGAQLHGKTQVATDREIASPHEVHIALSEQSRLEVPPAPTGAEEMEVGPIYVRNGAFDVQLFDATSGRVIGAGRKLRVDGARGSMFPKIGADGWLRLRASPGEYGVQVVLDDGPREMFTLTIPDSGYARGEWRLRSKP